MGKVVEEPNIGDASASILKKKTVVSRVTGQAEATSVAGEAVVGAQLAAKGQRRNIGAGGTG
jgi:hypothetical protein